MIDYEEKCRQAATHQGLDPAMAILQAAGIEASVWQTGGFCMCIGVTCGPDRYVLITSNDYFTGSGGGWDVGHYFGEDTCGVIVGDNVSDEDLPLVVEMTLGATL